MSHNHRHRHQARKGIVDGAESAFNEAKSAIEGAFDPSPSPSAPHSQSTFVSVVYVTASPTFDGPIGGYTTLGVAAASSTPHTTPTPTHKSSQVKSAASDTSLPLSLIPSSSIAESIPLVAATDMSSLPIPTPSGTSESDAATSNGSKATKSSGGMSTGGKVGLAIGIILLVAAVVAVAMFLFRKRKMRNEQLYEKNAEPITADPVQRAPSTRSAVNAPQLSLRPVTQFLPLYAEKRQSRAANAAVTNSTPNEKRSLWERPMGGAETDRNNPFGNHAETIDSANANGPPVVNEIGPGGEILSGLAASAVSTGPRGLARGASKRADKPLDLTRQGAPSPTQTEFSETSEAPGGATLTPGAAAIAAAGGPANSAVHRVQLDFKPGMDDELELKAGQLIRLLHEYDDGWALCIRLDRSRQGVVPRTCLSTRPVKPRPGNGPGPRGPAPSGMRLPIQGGPKQPRPQSPAMNQGGRPMSPAMNQGQRPMSPAMNGSARSMSPGPRQMNQNGGPQGRPMPRQGSPMQAKPSTPPGPQYKPYKRPTTPTGGAQDVPLPISPSGSPDASNDQNRSRAESDAQTSTPSSTPPGSSPISGTPPAGPPAGARGVVTRKPVGQAM